MKKAMALLSEYRLEQSRKNIKKLELEKELQDVDESINECQIEIDKLQKRINEMRENSGY